MKRREFIGLLGCATAWVSGVSAQEPRQVIGVLSGLIFQSLKEGGRDAVPADAMPAFFQGLKDAGFVEGRNISIEIRQADSHYDRLPSLAAELVGGNVAAIFAGDREGSDQNASHCLHNRRRSRQGGPGRQSQSTHG